MNDSFDGELSRRLRNYLEEPRVELWQHILTSTQATRRSPSTSTNTKGFLFLVFGLISLGGLYFFEQTGIKTPASALIQSAITKDSGNEETISDTKSKSEINKSTMQSDERFIPKESTVGAHSARSNQIIAVVDKTPEVINADMTIVRDDVSTISVNLPVTHASSSEEILQAGQYADKDAEKPRENGGLLTTSLEKKDNDEVKTVIHEKDPRDKASIYFTVMPTFGYQRINSNSSDNVIIESIRRISTFSTDRLGVRAELGVEDPITDRIKVFGGLLYYQRKQTIDYTEKQVESTEVSQGPNGEVVIVPKYAYVEKSFEYELKNLGVQLGLSYVLSERKFLQTIGTGFEFHVALNKLADNSQAPEFTNNPSAYVFYNLYYRLQYPAESRLKAVFQPTLNYSFYINQNLNAPFYVKPYGLGLNLGFTYNF